ncbi:MAG: CvpA family protein [Planctomicrobium sp.]|jgi:uncharacterized membrane protein required for colicin V production|nr:CvpA family protein [Planctomicrobium sp.]
MWYDILVLAILIYFTVRGAAKGMVWQLAGIAGIVICFVFADAISAAAGPYVSLEPPLNNWVILFGAYVVFTLISYVIAGRITEFLAKVKLKEFDKHLGAVFGFVKGVILCLIITFLAVTMSEDAREALKDSRSGVAAARIVRTLHPYLPILPAKLVDALEKYIHLLDEDGMHEHYADDHDHFSDVKNASNSNDNGDVIPSNQSNSTLLTQLTQLVSVQTQESLVGALQNESDPQTQNTLLQKLVTVLQDVPIEKRSQIEREFQLWSQQGSQVLLGQLKDVLQVSNSTTEVIPNSDPILPNSTAPPIIPNNPVVARSEIDSIRKQIVSAYTADETARLEFEKQIEGFLGTLPDNVYLGVLQDWNADIWSLPDPDRKTSGQSTLEERIVRQLEVAGISISSLKPEMQQRLKAVNNSPTGSLR